MRVIVVEDSDIMRDLLRTVLAEIDGAELVGEFESPEPAIASIRAERPDVVVLDVQLINGNGMEVMGAVRAHYPTAKVVVFTNFADAVFRKQYMEAGAYAFYDKNMDIRAFRRTLSDLASFRGPDGPTAISSN